MTMFRRFLPFRRAPTSIYRSAVRMSKVAVREAMKKATRNVRLTAEMWARKAMVDKSRVPSVTDLVTSHHSALICPILRDRYSPCQLNIRYQAPAKQRKRRRFVSLIRTDKNSSKFRFIRWADKKTAMEKATAMTKTSLAQ